MKSKFKYPFQIFFLLVIMLSPIGGVHYAQAGANLAVRSDAVIITHNLSIWEAVYVGFVNASTFEKWQFAFDDSHEFTMTVTPFTSSDLLPLLILRDGNGNELARGTGTLTSTQPVGNYSVEVQPVSGSGYYGLTLREVLQIQPSASTVINPSSINVDETATATVNLTGIPTGGYTGAEFTCTYDASLGGVSNITVSSLFGTDPAVAINGPQNGSFIVAVAGSNGNTAATDGAAFTFDVTGLQAGQTAVHCTARVSSGSNVLTAISSTATSLTILAGSTPTPTSTPLESPTPTSTPLESPTPTSEPVESPTATSEPVESSTPTSTPFESPTATSEPVESSTPTITPTQTVGASPTPQSDGTLTGQVIASKPVTILLNNPDSTLATSVTANADGTFSLSAPAGTYTVIAMAAGFLSAQGSVTLSAEAGSAIPTVSLLAGDIDNNNVIDQFDAMTIGMNYNTAVPSAADLNNDGIINVLDLELLARNYRKTGPITWQ